MEDHLPSLDVCTGCGSEAFVCIIGNGDPLDVYDGPYPLCEDAYKDWLVVGDEVVWNHD